MNTAIVRMTIIASLWWMIALSAFVGCGGGQEISGSVNTEAIGDERRALVVFAVINPAVDAEGRAEVRPGTTLRPVVTDPVAPIGERTFSDILPGCGQRGLAFVAWAPRTLPLGLAGENTVAGSRFRPESGDFVARSDRLVADCGGPVQVRLVLARREP